MKNMLIRKEKHNWLLNEFLRSQTAQLRFLWTSLFLNHMHKYFTEHLEKQIIYFHEVIYPKEIEHSINK